MGKKDIIFYLEILGTHTMHSNGEMTVFNKFVKNTNKEGKKVFFMDYSES